MHENARHTWGHSLLVDPWGQVLDVRDQGPGLVLGQLERTRLAQGMVERDARREGLRLWLAVGTAEETDDRDNDGLIDAVDDTQDIPEALARRGYSTNHAYEQQPSSSEDVGLYFLEDGQHNQASWANMLPPFLQWAYPVAPSKP